MPQVQRERKFPERTCVGCRQSVQKRDLIRVVRKPTGEIEIDPTLRAPGRGAYLHNSAECLDTARKRRALERSLKVELNEETYADLEAAIKRAEVPVENERS